MAGDVVPTTLHPDAPSGRPADSRAALEPSPGEADDRTLLLRSRAGDTDAFAELFRRYRVYAVRVAARTTGDLDPDDASAEAFARVWRSLRNGGGPDHSFKSYLATVVRHVIVNWSRGARELPTEPATLAEAADAGAGSPEDVAVGIAEAARVVAAFQTLPERWRVALWATEIEGRPVAELAESLRLSSNATSALCLRAREGLRVAWLQSHVEGQAVDSECRWVLDRLAAHARGRLPKGQRLRVERHLDACDACAATSRRLGVIGGALRVATLFVGTGVTLASLRVLGLLGGATTAAAATSAASAGGRAARAASRPGPGSVPAGIAAAVVTVAAVTAAFGLAGPSTAERASGEPLAAAVASAATVAAQPSNPTPAATSATPSPRRSPAPTPRPIHRTQSTRHTHPARTPAPAPTPTPTVPDSPSPTPTVPESPGPTPTPTRPPWTPRPPEPSWTPGPTPPFWTPRPPEPSWAPRPTALPSSPDRPFPLSSDAPRPGGWHPPVPRPGAAVTVGTASPAAR